MDAVGVRAQLVVLVLALLASACASDGRDLADAQVWQTTTTRPLPPTSAPPESVGATGITLSSPDFVPGDLAPTAQTCAGNNIHPTLVWDSAPPEAQELAITLSDQTDPENPLLLWLVAGLEPSLGRLDAGTVPGGAYETLNDYGQGGWGNPCLENFQNGRRDLQFRIYVLESFSGLAPAQPGNEAWDSVTSQAVDSATLLMRIDASAA